MARKLSRERGAAAAVERVTMVAVTLFVLAVATYVVLFTITSLTRLRRFSPDSMNYVDVARNIASGRGIVQSAAGFNEPHFLLSAHLPNALTSQPAGYPLLIAALMHIGVSAPDAALVLASLGYGVVLAVAAVLGVVVYGDACVSLVVVTFLLYFDPLRYVASFAWSEPLGIAWSLLSLLCLASLDRWSRWQTALSLVSGLLAGCAFATRYALLPLLPLMLGALFFVAGTRWQRTHRLLAYLLGWSVPAGMTLAHNLLVSGTLMGAPRNPSEVSFLSNLYAAAKVTLAGYLGGDISTVVQGLALLLVAGVCSGIVLLRGRLKTTLALLVGGPGRALLPLWALVYVAVLVYQRTVSHFDPIDERLVVPGAIGFVFVLAALLVSSLNLRVHHVIYPALILSAAAVYGQAQVLVSTPMVQSSAAVAQSARLTWVQKNTTKDDLIIGSDTVDIPFYLQRPLVISFSPYPYSDYPAYSTVIAFVHTHCARYRHVYVVLRQLFGTEQDWRAYYGSFIASVVKGDTQLYPHVHFKAAVWDGLVFALDCR